MATLARYLGFRRNKSQWENPRSSIGELRGVVRNGRYSCWEAVGPVREAWSRLGPEIKDYVENFCKYGPALSLEIYMIGRTEDTAAPKVLICSADLIARKSVRKEIMGSGIMDKYPAIGLGDTARLPDLLAQEDVESTLVLNSTNGEEIDVLSTPSDSAFGRRLFIPRRYGGPLRPATAGPILHINSKVYQLTVGHAFLELDDVAPPEVQSSTLDDCDFDGQSDSEDGDSCVDLHMAGKRNPTSSNILSQNSCAPVNSGLGSKLSDTPPSESPLSRATQPLPSSGAILLAPKTEGMVPQKLDRIGKLALGSEIGTNGSLDYALVELEGRYRFGRNEVACGLNSSQRWLRVTPPSKIGPGNVNVITMTASSGFLSGTMCATASYMRLPNQRTLQELYLVHLDGKLANGDCGSCVIDQNAGHLYGHIVAGNMGTGLAYIVPAMQVFKDISDRLGDVALVPGVKPKRTGLDSSRVVELGSKQYFSQLQHTTNPGGENNSREQIAHVISVPAVSSDLPISPHLPLNQSEINSAWNPSQPWTNSRGRSSSNPIQRLKSKLSVIKPMRPSLKVAIKRQANEEGNSRHVKRSTFEQHFFKLPGDIQAQIIASLRIPDILNLRTTSRNWHYLISLNEVPISRMFLELNPVPPFAICLYPLPDALDINLRYICGLWHRLFVASKLSTMMTEWITTEIFLRKTEIERVEFLPQKARMRRRLVPLLFTIFHFFETYRQLYLEHILKHGPSLLRITDATNAVELQIMKMYDSETLLQAHQAFPLLLSFLHRRLRPPSYLGRVEKSIRGYRKGPPPEHVQAAILCIGGLKLLARLSDINHYDLRMMAVDTWYAFISQEGMHPRDQSYGLTSVRGRHSRLASFNKPAATANIVCATSTSTRTSADHSDASTSSSQVFETSMAAGPPMGSLSGEHVHLLLQGLPRLQSIWIPTAEALLFAKHAVERRQDIKRNAQVHQELVNPEITQADELFYGKAVYDIIQEDGTLS
ncbi:uncharacterized protein BP5553_04829 [Venustampulla echinocandica]|uniref:F-box domain-containing protein n=1 Tax=Venustampulla echinocandica TaxID=2656787 RepID=A0A370TPE4_9HELO|nr:uncharacterized protein BP5553_04829 [Venustampulla echinocandica]RDL37396.1 hypothetical protein BP5553_04829 [Venustampulla echinocandica]